MPNHDKCKSDAAANAFERQVLDALEAAAMQGLCREGQIEAAVGVVRSLRPEQSPEQATMIVERIAGKA
ncbi:MAG: hypothetical protein IH626_06275 [Rhodospirillales bacterium]|nr:hypothetical protein [Rhodospirillales bacterium]